MNRIPEDAPLSPNAKLRNKKNKALRKSPNGESF